METELLYNSPVWVTLASKEVSKWVRRFPRNVFGHLYFPLSIDGFFYLKFGNQAGVLSDGLSHLKKPSFLNPISHSLTCIIPFLLLVSSTLICAVPISDKSFYRKKNYRRLSKLRLQDVIRQPWINTIFVADILESTPWCYPISSQHPFPISHFQTAFIVKALAIIHIASAKFSVCRF